MSGSAWVMPAPFASAPSLVLSGKAAFNWIGETLLGLGSNGLILAGSHGFPLVQPSVEAGLLRLGLQFQIATIDPSFSEPERDRLVALASAAQWILAIGGGKTLDVAKVVALRAGLPVITAPTSPSTCAAWTAHTLEGASRYVPVRRPYAVVLDEAVLGQAPVRHQAAGLAAGLAIAHHVSKNESAPAHARELARSLQEQLMAKAPAAFAQRETEQQQELSWLVLSSVQLAGMLAEQAGEALWSSGAPAIANAFTQISGALPTLFGERMGFALIVQLLLQGDESDAEALSRFFASVSLPVTLEQLGVPPATRIPHLCLPPDRLERALKRADALGQLFLNASDRR